MKNRQKGFSAVELIIILLVLVLLAVGGWYLWSRNKSKQSQNQTDTSQQSASNQNAQPSEQKYLTIKEWSVKFKLGSENNDANYFIKANEPNYAFVSVDSLKDVDECAADETSIGVITRFAKDDIEPVSGEPYLELVQDAKKVGDYYFIFGHAQAYCTEGQETKLKAIADAFGQSIKTAESAN